MFSIGAESIRNSFSDLVIFPILKLQDIYTAYTKNSKEKVMIHNHGFYKELDLFINKERVSKFNYDLSKINNIQELNCQFRSS